MHDGEPFGAADLASLDDGGLTPGDHVRKLRQDHV